MRTVGRHFRTRFRSGTWVRRNVCFEKKIIFNVVSTYLKRNLILIRSCSPWLPIFLFWATSPDAVHYNRAYILSSCISFSTLIDRVILRSISCLVRLVLFENLVASLIICWGPRIGELSWLIYDSMISLLAVTNCLVKFATIFSMVLRVSWSFLWSSSFLDFLTDQGNIVDEVFYVVLLRNFSLRLRNLDVKNLVVHWVGLSVAWVILAGLYLSDIKRSVWINALASTRVVIWNHLLLPWIFLLCLVKVVNDCSSIYLRLILCFQLRDIWTLRSCMMPISLSLHIPRLDHFIFFFLRSSFTRFCVPLLISLPPSVSWSYIRGVHWLFSSVLLNDQRVVNWGLQVVCFLSCFIKF